MHCLINDKQLKRFLKEDVPAGDTTSDVLISKKAVIKAFIIAEEKGVLCGMGIIKRLYSLINKSIIFNAHRTDGQSIRKGMKIVTVKGNARNILKGERIALNILQQLSGVATMTSRYVHEIRGTRAHIYDTRKTIPGLRELQKYAVRCGGGRNHRMTLHDAVLVKDNHLSCINTIECLAQAITVWRKQKKCIEIEADNLKQVREIMELDADIIMLDNFSLRNLRKAVAYIKARRRKRKPAIEVSGGISLNNIRRVASLGVERIAVGAITHSSPILNYTMEYT